MPKKTHNCSGYDCRYYTCVAKRLVGTSVQDLKSSLGGDNIFTYGEDVMKYGLKIVRRRKEKTKTKILKKEIKRHQELMDDLLVKARQKRRRSSWNK